MDIDLKHEDHGHLGPRNARLYIRILSAHTIQRLFCKVLGACKKQRSLLP